MVQGSRGPTLGSGGTDGQKTEGDTRRFTEPTGHHSPTPGSITGTREEPRAASLGRRSQRHPEPEKGPVGEDTEFALGTVSLHVQYAKRKRPETKRCRLGDTGDPPKLKPPEERGPVLSQEKRGPRTQTGGAAISKGSQEEGRPARRRGSETGVRAKGESDSPADKRGQTTPADAAEKPRRTRAENGPGALVTTSSQ